jgi:Flp pilus assembly protein TadG
VSYITARPSSRRARRGRGQALVEFALVFPIFMLVLSGIMDFGFMLYSRMSVINASREAAHAAIIVASPSTIEVAAQGAAVAVASQGGVSISNSSVHVSCLSTHDNPTSTSPVACGSAYQGDSVVVEVDYTYHSFFPLAFGATLNLSSTTQMVLEGAPAAPAP